MSQGDLLDRIETLEPNPFISGPGDLLAFVCKTLIGQVPQFKKVFGPSIDEYERDDYSFRELPALRIYNLQFEKEHESHYIRGNIHLDVIFPPSLRREERQRFQDIVSSALLQQFRRPSFFAACSDQVPGLNELGKVFSGDKTLGLKVEDGYAPLTHLTANFRIDQKVWDEYLESKGRTKDDPFEITLRTLDQIVSKIEGRNSVAPGDVGVVLGSDQNNVGGS